MKGDRQGWEPGLPAAVLCIPLQPNVSPWSRSAPACMGAQIPGDQGKVSLLCGFFRNKEKDGDSCRVDLFGNAFLI